MVAAGLRLAGAIGIQYAYETAIRDYELRLYPGQAPGISVGPAWRVHER
jgi:hypothetical protein